MTNNILISSDRFEHSQSWPSSIVLTSSYAVDSDWWINKMMDLRVDRNASQTLLNCQINHLISTIPISRSVFKRSSPRDRNLIDSILRLCQYSWSPLQPFSWLPLRGQWRGCRTINDYMVVNSIDLLNIVRVGAINDLSELRREGHKQTNWL